MPFSGPNDPSLPENVKRLPERQRRQWVSVWNSAFSRCMAGDTRITSPNTNKCEGFAFQNANGVVSQMKTQRFAVEQTAQFQQVKHLGREWLVVPLVLIREGVLNDLLVPAKEIGRYVETWDGIPVTLGHPQKNGHDVSANDPENEAQFTIGRLYNADFNGKRLRAEAWIDLNRVTVMGGDAQEVVDRLHGGQQIDVSAAYFSDLEDESGEFEGKEFSGIVRNIRPDHAAILLDEEGACSWKDGCGIPRTNEDREEGSSVNGKEIVKAFETLGEFIANAAIGGKAVEKKELIAKLVANKRCKFEPATLEAWEIKDLQALDASLAAPEDDETPEAKAARQKAEAEVKIKADADAAKLKAEADAKTAADVKAAAEEADRKKKELEAVPAWFVPFATKLEGIGTAVAGMSANQKAEEDAAKAEFIVAIKASTGNEFTDDELKGMTVQHLEKLTRSLAPSYFVGRTFPRAPKVDENEPPKMDFVKRGWRDDGAG